MPDNATEEENGIAISKIDNQSSVKSKVIVLNSIKNFMVKKKKTIIMVGGIVLVLVMCLCVGNYIHQKKYHPQPRKI